MHGLNLDQYVTCPLNDYEVADIATKAGKPIPSGVSEFLRAVGMPQNVIPAFAQDEAELVDLQKYEPNCFVFGIFGEDYLAESLTGEIVNVSADREGVIASDFAAFLSDYAVLPENKEDLCWSIQLSFKMGGDAEIRAILAEILGLNFEPGWRFRSRSPASVDVYATSAMCNPKMEFRRLEYSGWKTHMYFLNQNISVDSIHEFKQRLKLIGTRNVGFKLVNYGILPKHIAEQE